MQKANDQSIIFPIKYHIDNDDSDFLWLYYEPLHESPLCSQTDDVSRATL